MNNLLSPPTNDPIKKLQNLFNNLLHSIIDVINNLGYTGESKELEIESQDTSNYNYFFNLLKENEENHSMEINEIENDENKKKIFMKPYFEDSLKNEIKEKVERMNLIFKTIDNCIEDLPDSLMNEEEKCKEIKILHKKKDEAKEELKKLYEVYDSIYNDIKQHLKKVIINIKE